MAEYGKVDSSVLRDAGLEMMTKAGMPLVQVQTKGRSMIYRTEEGKTVRVRTCNDHILIVLADRDHPEAKLNIEGTDYLLVIMPVIPRTPGAVIAYLVPTKEAVEAARSTHREWLATRPNTKGDNRTWNLWFDRNGPVKANGFADKWAKYRLEGEVDVKPTPGPSGGETAFSRGPTMLKDVIAAAKQSIAEAAGVPVEAVRISIDLA